MVTKQLFFFPNKYLVVRWHFPKQSRKFELIHLLLRVIQLLSELDELLTKADVIIRLLYLYKYTDYVFGISWQNMTWTFFTEHQNWASVSLECIDLPDALPSFSALLDYSVPGLFSMPHYLHLGTSVPDAISLRMTLAPAACHETFRLSFHQEQNCITVLSSRYLCPMAIQPLTDAISLVGYREFISSCPAEFTLFLCWLSVCYTASTEVIS